MAFMYVINAKIRNWWEDVTFIVWGPSAKLLSQDVQLQDHIKKMLELGVEVVACRACADGYKVSEKLEGLGIEVKYMGEPLTELLKEDWKVITI
ncbi:DsrE family protein [Alkaliphilus serpentinus]|uniref:DsrE family protein n=2 Tax=Alkaliphilus serpentinus TaxID=1482731 RepID=A0A833HPF2_9FIRM|nr:DsrE family protein [Alkaliphilus serpentinus]